MKQKLYGSVLHDHWWWVGLPWCSGHVAVQTGVAAASAVQQDLTHCGGILSLASPKAPFHKTSFIIDFPSPQSSAFKDKAQPCVSK